VPPQTPPGAAFTALVKPSRGASGVPRRVQLWRSTGKVPIIVPPQREQLPAGSRWQHRPSVQRRKQGGRRGEAPTSSRRIEQWASAYEMEPEQHPEDIGWQAGPQLVGLLGGSGQRSLGRRQGRRARRSTRIRRRRKSCSASCSRRRGRRLLFKRLKDTLQRGRQHTSRTRSRRRSMLRAWPRSTCCCTTPPSCGWRCSIRRCRRQSSEGRRASSTTQSLMQRSRLASMPGSNDTSRSAATASSPTAAAPMAKAMLLLAAARAVGGRRQAATAGGLTRPYSTGTTWHVPGCVHTYRMLVQNVYAAGRMTHTHDIAGIALRAICRQQSVGTRTSGRGF
jgi:hypothetical protein